jgi:hypothetical protein
LCDLVVRFRTQEGTVHAVNGVSFDINERDAHGSRDYLARTIAGAPEGKVRVRLEGSNEELDVKPSSVQLPKGT